MTLNSFGCKTRQETMCGGYSSDPEGKAPERSQDKPFHFYCALPAWIAQGVYCRMFCAKRISSLVFFFVTFFYNKTKESKSYFFFRTFGLSQKMT